MSHGTINDDFETGANGWLIITSPGVANPRQPLWSAGQISYSPSDEQNFFFQAPAAYLGNQLASYGCNLNFTLSYDIHPVTFKNSPFIIIDGGGASIGLVVQTPSPTEGNAYPVQVTLAESAGWLSLPGNTPATADVIKTVLGNVTQLAVRGDMTNEVIATVSLSAVTLSYILPLAVSASIYYQDQKLYASWPAVADAFQYNIKVTDDAGLEVYTGTIAAAGYQPPVIAGDANWSPVAGKTYTVVVTAVGPGSDPVSVTTVDIATAVLSVQTTATGATFSWDTTTGATAYDLLITRADTPGTAVYQKENISSSPVNLAETDGLINDVNYNGALRGRTGNSFGDWSAAVPFALISARKILSDLQARLNNNKPTGESVIYNDTTFPAGLGDPGNVLNIIKSALSVADLTITLTGTVDLSDDGLTLSVAGTTLWGTTTATANTVFKVSGDLKLTMVLKLTLPDTWQFSDTFPTLLYTSPNYLYLQNSSIILSTVAYTDATVFYPLQAGLNYVGDLLYTPAQTAITDTTAANVQRVTIGGYITQDTNGVSLNFNGQAAVQDLSVALIGLPALTVTGGQVSVVSQAATGVLNTDTVVFTGSVALYGQTLSCSLDIPSRLGNKLSLVLAGSGGAAISKLTDALAPVSGTLINGYMPDVLNNLADLTVTSLEYDFDPAGADSTSATLVLSLNSSKTFDLIPSLVSISNLVFSISVTNSLRSDQTVSSGYSALISGTFTLGGLPVNISLAVPMQGDWTVTVQPQVAGSATLANIAGFATTDSSSILGPLPGFFQTLTSFSVDQIVFTASIMPLSGGVFNPYLTSVSFTLSQNSPWQIVPATLAVDGWTIDINMVNNNPGWGVSGVLNGNVTLGSAPGVTFNINLPIPITDEGWVIKLSDDGFDIPGLGDILDLVGASSLSNLLPEGIRNIGNIHVFAFEIAFDPTVASPIKSVFFQMGTDASQNWTLIENQGLVISNIETGITIVNDPDGVYAVGYIGGDLTIAGTVVSVQSSRMSKDDPWLLDLTTVTVIHVPGLSSLADWMLPTSVGQYLPVNMIPFSNGLDITDAGMQFDLTTVALNQVSFVIINQETWSILQGFITADNLLVDATIDTPLATPALTLHAEVLLNIGPVGILVAADKASPTADFIFSGTLDKPVAIDFEAAFSSMSLTFSMPYDYGFPRSLILETASATVNYTQGSFNFAATSTFNWSFNFGFTTLNILAVNLAIDIDPADSNGSHPYNLKAGGTFTLAGMQAVLNFTTSNIPLQDTILTASITADQVANISIENTVNTLVTTDTQGQKWNTVIPSGYTSPSFSSAYIHVNLSQNIFYLYGAATGLGGIAIIAKKIDDQTWGYALGLNLGSDFKFANIFSALSVIDDYLKVNSAGLFVVSYTGSTTTLVQDISAIDAFPDKPAGMSSILPVSNLPAISMTSGMMFYGDLNITTSGLFNKLVQIGADGTARVIIYGFINNTDSTQTIFIADLPDIVLFNTIKFTHQDAYTGIHLTYSPGNNNQFQLAARLVITLFDTDYSFDGNLTVNNISLVATIALVTGSPNNQIVNPFGVPGITIGGLSAQVNYTFGHDAIPAQGGNAAVPATQTTSAFAVSGTVLVGPAPAQGATDNRLACTAQLALLQSTPVLASIRLISDFSVGDFFAQCITGNGASWPTGLINITFLADSRIYYYDADADLSHTYLTDGDYTYLKGFNIDAVIKLTIIIDIDIAFTLQAIEDAPAGGNNPKTYKGVIATGGLLSGPIDLYVLEIAGTSTDSNGNYTGGPVFKLDTTTSPSPTMGFAAGFNFFKKPFGTADLGITKNDAGDLLLTGTLSSAVSFDPFGVLSLGFTYSSSDGFNITGWPSFDFLREAIDFVKTLQQIANAAEGGGFCSKLADFVVANAYTTKFTITPSFLTQSGGFYISISGTYQLSVLGNAFLSANFPNAIQIPLPSSLSLDDLPDAIFSALAGAATSFVNALLANPEAIAKFLVIVAGENAAKYAADMICNSIVDAAVDAAVAAGMEALADAGGIIAGGAAAIAAAATAILSILTSCFTAGTKVLMADGSAKNIEDVIVGDVLLGAGEVHNKVVSFDSPKLGNRKLYAINKGRHFVTEEHPFMTTEGWKSINPAATLKENKNLTVTALSEGDTLILAAGDEIVVDSIASVDADPATQLYNFILEGNNTYYADGFLVHNKGGDSCFVAGTLVLMDDGSEKAIEEIRIGDLLIGEEGVLNKVLDYDSPLLGDRLLYSFNNGPFFVTGEHPFLTEDGWKSINPEATARENPDLQVTQLAVGDMLILTDGRRKLLGNIKFAKAGSETQLYNFILEGNNTYFADGHLVHNKGGGGSCFVAGTLVLMHDGSEKTIQDIRIGDLLIGEGGVLNKVLDYDSPPLGDRLLYSFNGGPFFVTEEHPFLTADGWKSLNPAATARENPGLQVKQLTTGDVLIMANGLHERLDNIRHVEADPETQLYNFILEGNNTYYADGYLVHNKGGGDSCFAANTLVLMHDGSEKLIQHILIGDLLIGENGDLNKVLAYDSPSLGDRLLYSFNDGPFFVTEEHPFLTANGWKSLNPAATARENPGLPVNQLAVGDLLIMANGVQRRLDNVRFVKADPETQLYNFILEGNNTYYADGHLVHNKGGGSSCFTANTLVLMHDGSKKSIQDILIGDILIGEEGLLNKVLDYDSPMLGARLLYSFNDGPFFFTEEHPFLTADGWKSLNPAATAKENPGLHIKQLSIGDLLVMTDGVQKPLDTIQHVEADPATQLYNFILEGNNTYYADGYLVHNKGGGSPNNPAPPDFDTVTFANGILSITWDSATYADRYDFQFLKPDQSLLGTMTSVSYSSQKSVTVDLSDESLPSGNYTAQLRSGNGSFSSAWNSYAVTKPDAPGNIVLSYSSSDDKLNVTWSAVGSQTAYTVILLLDNAINQTQPASQLTQGYDAGTLAAGSYSAKIQTAIVDANNNYFIPGIYGLSQAAIVKPAAPTNPQASAAGDQINITWDAQDSDLGYQISLFKDGQLFQSVESSVKSLTVNASSYNTGAYTAQIRLKGDTSHLPSDYSAATQGISRLAAPQDVTFGYDAATGFTVGWSAVTGNNGYTVQIVDQQTMAIVAATASAAVDAITVSIPLSSFTPGAGPYIAEVKALGTAGALTSVFGQSTQSINGLAIPQDVTFSYDAATGFALGWTNVTGNNGYTVQIVDQQTKAAIAATASTAADIVTVSIPLSSFTPGTGPYIAEVKALGASGTLDSAYGDSTQSVNGLASPQDVTFGYNAAAGFTVAWSNVTGNNGYTVQIVDQQTKSAIAATVSAATDAVTVNIPLSNFTAGTGPYIAEVKALGAAGTLDSAYGDSTETVSALIAPQDITFTYADATTGFTIGWSAVTGNNGYTVQIVDQQTKSIIAATANVAVDIVTVNIPLSNFTAGTGPYIAEVKAIGAAGTLDSAFGESTETVSALTTPQDITFSYTDATAGFTIGWSAVTGNNGYTVQIVDQQTKAIVAATANTAVDIVSVSIPLSSFTAGTGPYIAEVKAIGAAGTLDSAYEDSTETVSELTAPQNITFSYTDATAGFTIGWSAVTGNNGYTVQIVDQQTKAIVAATANTAVDTVTVSIPLSSFTAGTGPYIAEVKAIGAAGTLDSAFGESTETVSALTAPQDITFTYADATTGFTIGWSAVTGNNGYTVQIVDQQTKAIVADTASAATDAVTVNIPLSSFTAGTGPYIAEVKAIGAGGTLDSAYGNSTQTVSALTVPQDITFSYTDAVTGFTVGWSAVTGNNGYTIQIVDQLTKAIIAVTASTAADIVTVSIPLSNFTAGTGPYIAEVKAIGAAGTLDSAFGDSSETVSALTAPQDITFRYDVAAGFTIGWSAVTGNNGYTVQIVDQQTGAIVAATANAVVDAITVSIPLSSFTAGTGPYIAAVKALGAAGTLDSAFGDSTETVSSLPAPQNVTFSYTDATTGFTIGWSAVTGNNGYIVQIVDQQTKSIIAATANVAVDIVTVNIPLSSFTAGTGPYIAEVKALVAAGMPDGAYGESTESVNGLAAPQDVTFSYDAAVGFTVAWGNVAGNNGYAVQIVDQQTKAVVAATASAAVDAIAVNIPMGSFTAGTGPYIAEVKALGATGTLDSVYGESTQSVNGLAAPQDVTFSYDASAGFTVGWGNITGNNGYTIQIVDQQTRAVVAATASAAVDAITVNIPLSSFTHGTGPYIAEVKALSTAGTFDSAFGESTQSVNELAAPQINSFVYDNIAGLFTITWNAVTANNGYNIQVIDDQTKLPVSDPVGAPTDGTSINISVSHLPGGGGTFSAQVKAIGAPGVLDSTLAVLSHSFYNQKYLQFQGSTFGEVVYHDPNYQNPGADFTDAANPYTLYNLMNDGFAIEAMVYVTAGAPAYNPILTSYLIDSTYLNDGYSLCLSIENGKFKFAMTTYTWNAGVPSNPQLTTVLSTDDIPVGQWVNLAVTHSAQGQVFVYVNGNKAGSFYPYYASMPGFTHYFLGKEGNNFFTGMIREVRIWRLVYTQGDISSDISSRLTPLTMDEIPSLKLKGLGAYWPLTDGQTSTADLINNNNFALSNPEWVDPSSQLAWPQGITFSYGTTGFTIGWDAVTGNNGYSAQIVDQQTMSVVAAAANAAVDAVTVTIPLSDFIGVGGLFVVQVKAMGASGAPDSSFGTSIQEVEQFFPPPNISSSNDAANGITVSWWNAITGNNGYAVRIVDQQTKAVVAASANAAANATSVNIPMSSFSGAPGAYVVQVKTLGAPGAVDSIYGELSISIYPQSNMKPIVQTMAYANVPAIPQGMKYTCTAGPDSLNTINNCPVVNWLGYTFWAFSYIDNRNSFGIVGYDSNGNVAAQWEKPGSRYIYKITIDETAKSVTFWGQANQTVVMTWDELNIDQMHYWGFDETSGVTAFDTTSSINGNLTSSVTWETPGCVGPGAVHIDGTDGSYVSFGTAVSQFGTADFTVALWFKTTETIRVFDLAGNRTDSSDGVFFCIRMTGVHESLPEGVVTIEVDENGSNYIYVQSQAQNLNDGHWHHIAAVRQGTLLQLYIDGALNARASGSGVANVNNANDFRIGRSLVMDVDRFAPNASFDELYVCKKAELGDQIMVLYNQKTK